MQKVTSKLVAGMIFKKCRIAFLPLLVQGEAFAGQEKPSFDDVYLANAMAQGRYDQDLAVRLLALDMCMTFYMQNDAHCRQSLRWRVWYATHDDDFFDVCCLTNCEKFVLMSVPDS